MTDPRSFVTPNGIEIEFHAGGPDENGKETQRRYLVTAKDYGHDNERYTSITTPLNVLAKDSLLYWTEGLGVQGMLELRDLGVLADTKAECLREMERRGLRWWQARDKAADRGTDIHDDLLKLVTGEMVHLDHYPVELQGFVRGVSAWFADRRPKLVLAETMVASPRHRLAGRFDLRCIIGGRDLLVDLKTTDTLPKCKDCEGTGLTLKQGKSHAKCGGTGFSRRFGSTNFSSPATGSLSVESGYDPPDGQAVLRVDSHGAYDFRETCAEPDDYLTVLEVHRMLGGLGRKRTEQRKQRELAEAA
jgi:hypothetical protein